MIDHPELREAARSAGALPPLSEPAISEVEELLQAWLEEYDLWESQA